MCSRQTTRLSEKHDDFVGCQTSSIIFDEMRQHIEAERTSYD